MKTTFYRHYKNKPYKFLGLVRHSETLEEMALYKTLYVNDLGSMWVRPKEMFFGDLQVNGVSTKRFAPIEFDIEQLESLDGKVAGQLETVFPEFRNSSADFGQVIFEGEKSVGIIAGSLLPQDTFQIQIFSVVTEYRSLGLGSLLLDYQLQWCQQKEIEQVTAIVPNEDSPASRLFFKNKFKVSEVVNLDQLKMVKRN